MKLHAALKNAFPKRTELRSFLRYSLNISLDDIDDSNRYDDTVFELVAWTESRGRISELIERAMKEKPRNQLLRATGEWLQGEIERRSSSYRFQPADPYDAWLLRRGQPFVNRKVLRDHVKELATDGSRILVVDGPPSSGKTYSLNFISHISDTLQNCRIAWIDVEQGIRANFSAEQIAVSIVSQMGRRASLDYIPKQNELQEARWLLDLRDWLIGEINQTNITWWIVCDGLCHVDVPPSSRDFLRLLMRSAHFNVPQLRVVILAYKDDILPPDIASFIRKEKISDIGPPEISEYFKRLVARSNVATDAVALEAIISAVILESAGNPLSLNAALLRETNLLTRQ
jgi:hypothetical protein